MWMPKSSSSGRSHASRPKPRYSDGTVQRLAHFTEASPIVLHFLSPWSTLHIITLHRLTFTNVPPPPFCNPKAAKDKVDLKKDKERKEQKKEQRRQKASKGERRR